VNTGYVMATLLRENPMLLRFQVEPLEAPRLKPGMPVKFTMRETQREFSGKITLTAGAADPTTRMVGVTAEVDATDNKYWLRPGSFCDVSIDVGATRESSVIPRSATRATDRGYVAYVLDAEGDQAEERVLKLGMSTKDGWVEVRDGLESGDWVIVRGAEALTPGARVRVTKVSSMDAGAPPLEEPREMGAEAGAPRERGDGGFRGDGGGRKRKPDAK
jgi:RND family efflux transporter MFP subunit